MNGGFLVTKIKQLGDRTFERILSKKGIDAFNGAQGRILYALWQEDGVSIKTVSKKCGLAITSLTTMLERMEKSGLIRREQDQQDKRKTRLYLTEKSHSLKDDYDDVSAEWEGYIIKVLQRMRLYSLSHISNVFRKILRGGVKNEHMYKRSNTEHESGHRLYCGLSILLRA